MCILAVLYNYLQKGSFLKCIMAKRQIGRLASASKTHVYFLTSKHAFSRPYYTPILKSPYLLHALKRAFSMPYCGPLSSCLTLGMLQIMRFLAVLYAFFAEMMPLWGGWSYLFCLTLHPAMYFGLQYGVICLSLRGTLFGLLQVPGTHPSKCMVQML